MTTIIGIQTQQGSLLVADSRITDDAGKVFSHQSVVKISERSSFLIAGAGEVLPCDIAQHIWKPPKVMARDKQNLYHFMVSKAMPSLRRCLKENGYNFDEPGENRFQFLISVNGELFEIDDDLGITRSDSGFYGVGSGSSYALGALEMGASPEQAMDIASKLTAFTAKPYIKMFQSK